jgi:CheY-like chemotaxis protein
VSEADTREVAEVLVVDDSAMVSSRCCAPHRPQRPHLTRSCVKIRKMISRALAQEGITVQIAQNGKDGVDMMRRKRYRAVLMDFLMPVMDGISATAEVGTACRDLMLDLVSILLHAS